MNTYADDEQMIGSSVMLFATCDVIYMNPKSRELFPNVFLGLSVYFPGEHTFVSCC
jgi:hypothetical protein